MQLVGSEAMEIRPSSGGDSSPQVIVSAKASRIVLWISRVVSYGMISRT
jgi:hypothetical protein